MKIIYTVSRWMGYISTVVLGLMMLLTVVDVTGRYFSKWVSWASPVTGATELTELMMIVVVFPALAWCALENSHVRVDLIMDRFPKRAQAITNVFVLLLTLATYAIFVWRTALEAIDVKVSSTLIGMPDNPFYWVLTGGLALFCLSVVVLIIKNIAEAVKK